MTAAVVTAWRHGSRQLKAGRHRRLSSRVTRAGTEFPNYIWDIRKMKSIVEPADIDLEPLRLQAGRVDSGGNIPLFGFG
jgi:hypothetical protein